MRNFLWVIWATLRAALWRSTPADCAVTIGTVLLCAVVAAASDAAHQYLTAEGAARFSFYGINSIVAEIAVCAAVALLFISRNRAVVLARFLVLYTLVDWLLTAAIYFPVKFKSSMPGIWTRSDTVILVVLLLAIWWVGAVVAILRGAGVGRYESPAIRGFALAVVSLLAGAALPAYPTFVGSDFNLSSYNVWEWGYAKFAKGTDERTAEVVNHRDTIESAPVANRTNFAAAVHAIAGIMNKDEDVLLVFITSHGSPAGVGLVLADALSVVLSPDHVASVLDREGIKNRLIIVSACYSGVFAKRLAAANSIVLTAADENSPSFGCSNEREWTFFGDAFFNQSLSEGVSLKEAFEDAKVKISQWEIRDDVPPSSPQGHFGSAISEKLAAKLKPGKEVQALSQER
jgi:hypothetical protein